MANIEFKPVEKEQIPRRGKYRKEVRKWVDQFLKSGDKALRSNEFKDRDLAMSYYDSFKDHIKKKNLPVDVKIRKVTKNPKGTTTWHLFLIRKEALAGKKP